MIVGGGVIISNNHRFPNIIAIVKKKAKLKQIFTTQYLYLRLLEQLCDRMSVWLYKYYLIDILKYACTNIILEFGSKTHYIKKFEASNNIMSSICVDKKRKERCSSKAFSKFNDQSTSCVSSIHSNRREEPKITQTFINKAMEILKSTLTCAAWAINLLYSFWPYSLQWRAMTRRHKAESLLVKSRRQYWLCNIIQPLRYNSSGQWESYIS